MKHEPKKIQLANYNFCCFCFFYYTSYTSFIHWEHSSFDRLSPHPVYFFFSVNRKSCNVASTEATSCTICSWEITPLQENLNGKYFQNLLTPMHTHTTKWRVSEFIYMGTDFAVFHIFSGYIFLFDNYVWIKIKFQIPLITRLQGNAM